MRGARPSICHAKNPKKGVLKKNEPALWRDKGSDKAR
jgi:hypothetical protein